eukprot:11480735-Alexandrium_andersonii.AAC.1
MRVLGMQDACAEQAGVLHTATRAPSMLSAGPCKWTPSDCLLSDARSCPEAVARSCPPVKHPW